LRTLKFQKLSDASLEIMKIVWGNGESSINQIFESINARRNTKLKRATVQVQLRRLENYGWLTHRLEGREYLYSALREREEATRRIVNDVRNRLFGGSSSELVRFLFEDLTIDSSELERIKEMMRKFEPGESS
jgi:BlaI family penicillinase repressor